MEGSEIFILKLTFFDTQREQTRSQQPIMVSNIHVFTRHKVNLCFFKLKWPVETFVDVLIEEKCFWCCEVHLFCFLMTEYGSYIDVLL